MVEHRKYLDLAHFLFFAVVNYLGEISSCSGVVSNGAVVHDDEQALYTLIQSDFNAEEALRRRKLQAIPSSSGWSPPFI